MKENEILEIINELEKSGIIFSQVREESKILCWFHGYLITFFENHIELSGQIPYLFARDLESTIESQTGAIKVIGNKTTSNKVIDNVLYDGEALGSLDSKMMSIYSPEKLYINKYYIYTRQALLMIILKLNEYLISQNKEKKLVQEMHPHK